jgi:hypothetical protein
MENLFEDGDSGLLIRTKINAADGCFKIMETDVLIAAGAVESIPVVTLTKSLIWSGQKVTLVDIITGETHELTLADHAEDSDTYLTITSYTFASNIAVGSAIYYKFSDLLNLYFFPELP